MTLPKTMRAFVLTGHGDFDKLEYHTDWPVPQVLADEVLIKVHACGLNNTDVNTRTAWYSKSVTESTTGGALESAEDDDATWGGAPVCFPRIQGADVVGTVVSVGQGVDSSLVGKRVLVDTWLRNWDEPLDYDQCGYYGSESDGGFAEYTRTDYRQVHIIESPLSHTDLACFATAYITAENMLNRANVVADDTVLISGASGGVGSALIQLAKRRGAKTIAMCGDSKRDQVEALNPTAVLSRAPDKLAAALLSAIGQPTVTVVADVVGGDNWPSLIDVLARRGRYTCAGAIAGPMVAFDLRTFYLRDLTFTGATVVPPGVFANLVTYIEKGEIEPLVAQVHPLESLHDAQRAFIAKKHIGNIVIDISP